MPYNKNEILSEYSFDSAIKFPVESGRSIWNTLTLTGVNRAPVTILSAFVTADAKVTGIKAEFADPSNPDDPAIGVDELANRLLVDGSLAVLTLPELNDNNELLEFQNDLVVVKSNLVEQRMRKKDKPETFIVNLIRRYKREGIGKIWVVEDITNIRTDGQVIKKVGELQPEQFYAYPNKVNPEGILFPYQHMYHRIEEIEEDLREQTGPASLAMIVSGYVGDIKKAHSTFRKGGKVVFIPGNATVTRVANNNFIDPMMTDADRLTMRYFKNMNITIEIQDIGTQSGVSRRIQMTPMLSEIERQRTMIKMVYANWGVEVSFGGIDILSSEDKEKEMTVLKSAMLDGVITRDEYIQKARKLFDLEGEPAGKPVPINVLDQIG